MFLDNYSLWIRFREEEKTRRPGEILEAVKERNTQTPFTLEHRNKSREP
jgi:hypothetical protein